MDDADHTAVSILLCPDNNFNNNVNDVSFCILHCPMCAILTSNFRLSVYGTILATSEKKLVDSYIKVMLIGNLVH